MLTARHCQGRQRKKARLIRCGADEASLAIFVGFLLHGVVAVGVLLLPVPAVGAHLLDAVLSLPAQLTLGLGGVGVALGDVAGAARVDDIGDLFAAGFSKAWMTSSTL